MAKAASAPSAAATTTHWTARDASPANQEPPEVGALVLSGSHSPLVVELAAETHGERGLLRLTGGEEQRTPIERFPLRKNDSTQNAVITFQANDTVLSDRDPVVTQALAACFSSISRGRR